MKGTSISGGFALTALLLANESIAHSITGIWPVVAPERAAMPYITYRRKNLNRKQTSAGDIDSALYDIDIFAEDYAAGVQLAEAVAQTLADADQPDAGIYSSTLVDASEGWAGDGYYQFLSYQIKFHNHN